MIRKKTNPTIRFNFADKRTTLPNRRELKKFIVQLFELEGSPIESLDYIFCSDPYLRTINVEFLNHDYHTDIITFPLSEPNEPIQGEVYISLDSVKDNATHYKVPVLEELLRVIFHGALHLCGHKDKTAEEQQLMTQLEDKYLQLYGSFLF